MARLTNKVAKITVHKALLERLPTGGLTMVYSGIKQFLNITTLAILNLYTNQEELDTFSKTKELNYIVMEEVVFGIGEHIFGSDIVGCNGVYYLKRLTHDYKLNPNCRIRKWATLMTQLNKFSLHAK